MTESEYLNALISVIIPIYNTKDYLTGCIDSVLNQTYKNLEVILVDDGSTDGSAELCDRYALLDNRVKVIHTPNGGTSSARNEGMRCATGKYWGFIDSDDYIALDFYEKLASRLSDKIDIVSCGVDTVQLDGRVMRQSTPKEEMRYFGNEIVRELLINTNYFNFSMCNKLFKRELLKGLSFPIGKRHEEILVMYEIARRSKGLVCLNKAMYYYTVRMGSNSRHPFNLSNLQMADATLEMYKDVRKRYPQYIDIALYRHLEYVLFLIEWIADAEEDYTEVRKVLIKHLRKYTLKIIGNKAISDDLKARMLLLAWKDECRLVNKIYENSSKYLETTRIFDVWLKKKQEGISIERYFIENEIKSVAIYGMSHLGQRLRDELRNSSVEVKYVVDRNAKDTFADTKIITPDEEFEEVDMIVVTADFYYREIKELIKSKGDFKVESLKTIIMKI